MSTPTPNNDGVHRLVDMIVEEVSLVDRAANKQRFLVVKRNAPMKNTPDAKSPKTKGKDKPEDGATPKPKPGVRSGATKADTAEAIAMATALVERLTEAAEMLGEASDDEAEPIIIELASELSEAAAELAEAAGVTEEEEEESETEKGAVGKTIAKVRALLAEVSSMLKTAKAAGNEAPPAIPASTSSPSAPASSAESRVVEQLASVASSLHSLTDAVKDQGQRLGRLEKGIALPNSRAHDERPPARDADVGWPLDLNRPLDRENVDKSTSFHE